MENARPIQVLKLLGARKTWLLVGLIFLGRMVYFAYWGTLLEIDSLGYLHFQTALYHPPLYSAFCWVAMQIGRSVDAVVVAQSLFYSLCAGLLIGSWGKTWKMQVLIAFLLAVEPCSGKLACTVMAETVFLSLLMLSWLSLSGIQNTPPRQFYRAVAVSGLVLGFAYETRYAAPVFLVAILVWMIFSRLQWRRIVLAAVLIFLAFQISLLPLRSYYQLQFGTWQTNAFSSLSLWNTSAYLYPGSTLSREFKTEFEASLHQFRDGDFALYHTWHTN
jgi:hypothetical protein